MQETDDSWILRETGSLKQIRKMVIWRIQRIRKNRKQP